MMKPVVLGARRAPKLAVKSFEQDLSSSDRAIFRRLNPDPRPAMTFFLEAFRSGTAGVVDDYRVLAAPWGFAPEAIEMPVHFWHGDADRMAGFAEARAVADRMPNARFNLLPGEGHLLLDHRDIFTTLALGENVTSSAHCATAMKPPRSRAGRHLSRTGSLLGA